MKRTLTVIAALVLAMLALSARAQVAATEPATQPSDPLVPKVEDPMAGLKDIDPAELEKTLKRANENRLKMERQLVQAEMENKMYEPDAMEAATKILDEGATNVQADNIDRIIRAYAKLDRKFGEVYKLYTDKKYELTAQKAESMVNEQSTYLNAVTAYVRAISLEKAGKIDDAGDAYSLILEKMYDRVSFACDSSMRLAKMFEDAGRGMYAMQAYAYLLKNYSLTLDLKTLDEVVKKAEKLKETYGDPLGTVAKLMGGVKERLHQTDSGKDVQDKEEQIVAMLNDLIRIAEAQSQSKSQAKPKPKPKQGDAEKKKSESEIKTPSQKPTNSPSKPAADSVLRLGDTTKTGRLDETYKTGENGDWAALPPEKRAQLEEKAKRQTSERQAEIIRDSRRAMAEGR